MFVLVTGGSGSGKSVYAENLAVSLKTSDLVYAATMIPYDEECIKKIKKHRLERADKGFRTVECFTSLEVQDLSEKSTVLLDCISNLTANIVYAPKTAKAGSELCRGEMQEAGEMSALIAEEVLRLAEKTEHLVVVTNEISSDGGCYAEETLRYRKILGLVNQELAKAADQVLEIVYGIPVKIKQVTKGGLKHVG